MVAFPPNKLGTPLGYQQLAVPAASTALTVPTFATQALMTVEVANIRWRDDGVVPTAAIGMLMAVGGGPGAAHFLYSGDLAAFRCIQVAVGAILNISYYG